MKPPPALTLMRGQTTHARYVPFERSFRYRLLMIDLDIDRLSEADSASPVFSVERPNLFSFRRKDHGAGTKSDLRPWAEARFAETGVDASAGAIRLLTFPRHAFYKFSPISVWRLFGHDGAPKAVIYEVNNTFGEQHSYVASLAGDAPSTGPTRARHEADKAFHVSPFFSVDGRYAFTLRTGDPTRFSLIIETRVDGTRTHIAALLARAEVAGTAPFLRSAVTQPLSTLGVTAGIHWEALWIWRRGARYQSKPAPPTKHVSVAQAPLERVSVE